MDKRHEDKVGSALSILCAGLLPFVESEMRRVHALAWESVARACLPEHSVRAQLDAAALFGIMQANWNTVFRHRLSQVDRGYLAELRDARNRWAHQQHIDT